MMFLISIRHNLTNLFNFSGRESRAQFWPYVGFVVILMTVGMFGVMVPAMANTFARMQKFALEHPDQATVQSGPGSYSISIEGNHPELMPDMGALMAGVAILSLLIVVLLAAAVVRRLHDRSKSGAWGIMPLPFLAFGFLMMSRIFVSPNVDMILFFTLFFNNLIYLTVLVILVVLLAGESSIGTNRFGLPPSG